MSLVDIAVDPYIIIRILLDSILNIFYNNIIIIIIATTTTPRPPITTLKPIPSPLIITLTTPRNRLMTCVS